jgi:hypothetical protein
MAREVTHTHADPHYHVTTCAPCHASWEVRRACDPLHVEDDPADVPAPRSRRVIAWIALAAVVWLVVGLLAWRITR